MDEFNLSVFQAGLLVSIPRFIQLLMSLPSGLIADRFNARKLISTSLFLEGLAGLLIYLYPSIWSLFVGFTLIALSSTFYHPPALSATTSVLPENYRGRGLGLHGACGTLGVSLGPITLGLILHWLGWKFVFAFWLIPIFIVAISALLLKFNLKHSVESEAVRSISTPLRSILSFTFISLLIFISVRTAASSSISTFMTTYLSMGKGIDPGTASIIFGLSPLIGLVGSILGGFLGDKLGWRRSFTIIFISISLTLTMIFLSPAPFLIVIFYLAYGLFNAMTMPISSSLVAFIIPPEARGTAYSAFFMPVSISGIVMPIIASLLVDLFGIWIIFPISILLFILCLIIVQIIKI